jgi:type I restriction enzyme, S subunit
MISKAEASAMKQSSDRKLTPKLRFPEFNDHPAWDAKPLGSLFSERQEAGLTNLRLLSLTDKEGVIPQEETNRKNNASLDKSKYLRVVPGDVAYNTMRMWEGRSAYVAIEGLVSPAYTVCKPNAESNGLFFSYYFKTQQLIEQFRRYSQGLVKDTLNLKFEAFSRISVPSPGFREQQKIADCLSSLDEVIATQVRKVDTLKAYKKGLMQQLFPREGETLPRLRFPEFRDAPEWCVEPLGELFETMTGGTPDRTLKKYWNGTIPWVTTSLIDFNVIYSAEEFINAEGLENSSAKLFPKDTVLIAMYGQGKTRGKVALLGIEATTNQACAAILPGDKIDPAFTFMSLCGRYDEMRGLSNSGGQENLSQGIVRELPFRYPKDIAEQREIVDCLSALNDLVAAQSQKLNALKTHKKGMMQQLFPSAESPEP